MRIFKLSIIIAGLALFIFGCAGNQPAPPNVASNATNNAAKPAVPTPTDPDELAASKKVFDEFDASRKIYKDDCARCHMDNGEGGQPNIDGKTIKVPSFKRPSAIKAEDVDLIEQIEKGGEGMPGFGHKLKAEEMKTLVAFIRKEFQGK